MRTLLLPSRGVRARLSVLLGVTLLLGCDDLQWLLDDPSAPPDPPVISDVESPTRLRRVGVGGNKPAGTGVLVDDDVVVPLDGEVLFGFILDLEEGERTYEVRTFDGADQRSEAVTLTVDLDVVPPSAPTVDPPPPLTIDDTVTLTGTRDAGAALWLNGAEALPAGDATTFSVMRPLAFGENVFRVAAQDAVGNESEVVVVTVTRVADLDVTPPPAPELDPVPVLSTSLVLPLSGTLAEDADLVVNGAVALEDAPAGPFTASVAVSGGVVALDVRARDQADNLSDPVSPAPTLYVNPAGLLFAVHPLPAVVLASPVTLTGIRGGDVDVYLNGAIAAPADGDTAFSVTVPLASGDNDLVVEGRAGPASASVMIAIHLDAVGPLAPTLDEVEFTTVTPAVTVSGQRPPGTAVLRGMIEVVAPGPDAAFSDDVVVEEGVTTLRYAVRDSYGRVSPEVLVTVTYLPAPVDAGPPDAGPADAGLPDAGPPDPPDAGDAGPVDAGTIDAGQGDAGQGDAGPLDAGPTDGGDGGP